MQSIPSPLISFPLSFIICKQKRLKYLKNTESSRRRAYFIFVILQSIEKLLTMLIKFSIHKFFSVLLHHILHFIKGDSTGKCSVGIWQDMIPFHVNAQGKPSVIVTGYSEKMEMTEAISNKEFGLQWSNRQ